jgi:hypothetical protein
MSIAVGGGNEFVNGIRITTTTVVVSSYPQKLIIGSCQAEAFHWVVSQKTGGVTFLRVRADGTEGVVRDGTCNLYKLDAICEDRRYLFNQLSFGSTVVPVVRQ